MRDRIVPIDELFARASDGGAPFELLRDEDSSRDGEQGPADVELMEWEVRGDRAAVEGNAWDEALDPADDDDFAPDELEHSPIEPTAPPAKEELSFAQHQVYGEAHAYGAALARLLPYVRQRASRIAGGDPHLAGDLTQEALIELWEIDASRFDEDDQMYLKQALVRRMIDAVERDLMQELLVPRATVRAFAKLRKEIGPSIHDLGPHRPLTFSDSEVE